MTVKLVGQQEGQTSESRMIYHDALDLSVEDNSQSDVLDIIVLPDSNTSVPDQPAGDV